MDCPWCSEASVWDATDMARWLDHLKTCPSFPRPGAKPPERPRLTLAEVRRALQYAVGALDREHSAGEAATCRHLLHDLAVLTAPHPGTSDQARDDDYVIFVKDVGPIGQFGAAALEVEDFNLLEGSGLVADAATAPAGPDVDPLEAHMDTMRAQLAELNPEGRERAREVLRRLMEGLET